MKLWELEIQTNFFFFLLLLSFPCFIHTHLIFHNETNGLALFEPNQSIPKEEDDLDEWHEKYMKYHVDHNYRILVDNSIFEQDVLQNGGFVLYAFGMFLIF